MLHLQTEHLIVKDVILNRFQRFGFHLKYFFLDFFSDLVWGFSLHLASRESLWMFGCVILTTHNITFLSKRTPETFFEVKIFAFHTVLEWQPPLKRIYYCYFLHLLTHFSIGCAVSASVRGATRIFSVPEFKAEFDAIYSKFISSTTEVPYDVTLEVNLESLPESDEEKGKCR
jgi:hypothetical protein